MDGEYGEPHIRDIRRALRPKIHSNNDRDKGYLDQHLDNAVHCCVNCRIHPEVIVHLPSGNRTSYYDVCKCACRICDYCSEECSQEDYPQHKARCDDIRDTKKMIYDHIRVESRGRLVERPHKSHVKAFVGLFVDSYGCDFFDTQSEYAIGEGSKSCWKDYFLLRQRLIEQLLEEGIARTDGDGKMKQNELALNAAISHCEQLFIIDKYDSYYSHVEGLIPRKEILMNLYLITGRFQELYDTCCFYTYNGEQTTCLPYRHHYQYGLNWARDAEDISKSFFDGNMRQIHHASFPAVALNHMYLLKQVMHEIMKVLIWVDSQFLSSHDCVATIGEFLGLDREWITFEVDWYKNQALEIMRIFVGCKASDAFGKLHGYSDKFTGCSEFYFNSGDFQQMKQLVESSLLDTTKKISHPLIYDNSPRALIMQSSTTLWELWEETLVCYEREHMRLLDMVSPYLEDAFAKLNDIAGYDAVNMDMISGWWGFTNTTVSPEFIFTRFVRDAMEICQQNLFDFNDFIDFVDFGLDYGHVEDPFDFGYTILEALIIERKIAQGFYYLNLSTGLSTRMADLLEKLPEGSRFRRTCPPPMNRSEIMSLTPGKVDRHNYIDRIKSISRCLPDVTDVIETLFNAGLATNENLTILFGDSSIVCNTLLDLHEKKLKVNQTKLTDFWAKKRKHI